MKNSTDKFNQNFTALNNAVCTFVANTYNIPFEEKGDFKQEILIKAFKNIDAFDPEKMKATTFIFQIGKTMAIDLHRKNTATKRGGKTTKTISLDFEFDLDGNNLHDLIGKNDNIFDDALVLKKIVHSTISNMSEKLQTIYDLFFVQQMSLNEIEEETKFPMGTIKNSIFNIRKVLSGKLKAFEYAL